MAAPSSWRLVDFLTAAALFFLFFYCARLLWALTPVNPWDEIHVYLGHGNQPISQVWLNAEWSPLYVLWYFLLSLFRSVPTDILYLNQALLPFLMLASWYFLLRRLGWSAPVAAIALLCLASHPSTWLSDTKVHHFSLWIATLAAWGALAFRRRQTQWLLTGPIFALLVLTRPEMLMLFPVGLAAYLFYFFRQTPRPPRRHLLAFLKVFLCSGLACLAFGSLSGMKAGETYFKKHVERLEHLGKNTYASEVELQKDLFPDSTGAFTALFDNPKVFAEHSWFHLKFYLELWKKFFWALYHSHPRLMAALGVLLVAGLAFSVPALRHRWRLGLPSLLVFFLIAWPHFSLALIYGTLERYNIATLFVMVSVLSAPLLALPRWAQRISAVLAVAAFLLSAPAWKTRMQATVAPGYWNHYASFADQMRSTLKGSNARILTNCGAIWLTIYPYNWQSDNLLLMHNSNRIHLIKPPAETLKRFDAVVFCDLAQERKRWKYIEEYWQELARSPDFVRFRALPIDTVVYVRPAWLQASLPEGVSRY